MKYSEKPDKKRTQRDYNLGFKLAVVLGRKGEMVYKQAQKAYGIQGRSIVLVWLRKHGTLDWSKSPNLACVHLPKNQEVKKISQPDQRSKAG